MTEIIPTLYIALGGIGGEIALRLRRRILAHAWGYDDQKVQLNCIEEFPLVQFILFDLDFYGFLPTDGPEAFTDQEKHIVSFDLMKYFCTDEELLKYPLVAEWFPCSRTKVRDLNINTRHGAGQLRCLSRLYFFENFRRLKNLIQTKINILNKNTSKAERFGLQTDPSALRVVVFSSSAGGTGSGSFIDMGYLVKCLVEQTIQDKISVDLFFMLPGGFDGFTSRKEANTYAALMELETCMLQDAPYFMRWELSEKPELTGMPYNNIFLFDSINLSSKSKKLADLYDMTADILFEDLADPLISERRRSLRATKRQYNWNPFFLPVNPSDYGNPKISRSKMYSSFGHSRIDANVLAGMTSGESLFQILEGMTDVERKLILKSCLEDSMPSVDIEADGVWQFNPNSYFCIIGVHNSELFKKRFGDELRDILSAYPFMDKHEIRFYETKSSQLLTCYMEMTGMPLVSLKGLNRWYKSYKEETGRLPVHTHHSISTFVHPRELTKEEFEHRTADFLLFVQAVALGVLTRIEQSKEAGLYNIQIKGQIRQVGDEKLLRQEGFDYNYRNVVRTRVEIELDKLSSPDQLAMWTALMEYYCDAVYPLLVLKMDGICKEMKSLPTLMCEKLVDEWTSRLLKVVDENQVALLLRAARDALINWTNEVPGSIADVYHFEVNIEELKPKRVLKGEILQPDWELMPKTCQQIQVHMQQPGTQNGSMAVSPSLPPQFQVFVAINGQQAGPFDMAALQQMVLAGQLTKDTLVWMQGMGCWAAASTVAGVSQLFGAVPPPLPLPGT